MQYGLQYKNTMFQQIKKLNDNYAVDFNSQIGHGSSGDVYLGKSPTGNVAVKVIPLKEINNQVTGYLLQCQLEALKAIAPLGNPFVLRLKDIIVRDEHCYIVMQLYEGGTLSSFLSRNGPFKEDLALTILTQILQGYRALKQHEIVHRDLKPTNIMFDRYPSTHEFTIKIIDFGYCVCPSVKNKPQLYYNVGSPRYMAPEAYKKTRYTEKSDVWSMGVMFYEMLTGRTFDEGKSIVESLESIREHGIPMPARVSHKVKHILQRMLTYQSEKRAGIEEILWNLEERGSNDKDTRSILTQRELSKPSNDSTKKMEKVKSFDRFQNSKIKPSFKNKVIFNHMGSVRTTMGPKQTFNHVKSYSPVKHQPAIQKCQPFLLLNKNYRQQIVGVRNSFPVKINFKTIQPPQREISLQNENQAKPFAAENLKREMKNEQNPFKTYCKKDEAENILRANRIQTNQNQRHERSSFRTVDFSRNTTPRKNAHVFHSPNTLLRQIQNNDVRGSLGVISPKNTCLNSSLRVKFGSGSEVKAAAAFRFNATQPQPFR